MLAEIKPPLRMTEFAPPSDRSPCRVEARLDGR
jgi:hypothetical protein